MKTRVSIIILILALSPIIYKTNAQSLQVSAELKELIGLSVNKDRMVVEKTIDKQIAEEQRKAVRSSYLPKLELGGKYVFAYSTVNSKIGNIEV
jgi:outer membrane protein TolC